MPVIPFSQDELVQALQKIGVSDSMGGLGPQGMAIKGPRAAADFSKLPINAWLNDYLRRVRTGGFKIKEPSKSIVRQLGAKQNLGEHVRTTGDPYSIVGTTPEIYGESSEARRLLGRDQDAANKVERALNAAGYFPRDNPGGIPGMIMHQSAPTSNPRPIMSLKTQHWTGNPHTRAGSN